MSPDNNLSVNQSDETGGFRPTRSLLLFLDEEIRKTNDFYKNLSTEYDETIYQQFEDRFIDLRKSFKGKLQDISDPDHEYINHTQMRRTAIEQILSCATEVAERFQEAKENNRLDRPRCTDALEDLIYAINNLKHIIQEQSKI